MLQVNREKKGLIAKITNYAFGIEYIRNYVFGKAREQVMKLSGGLYPAPLKVYLINKTKFKLIFHINFFFYFSIYIDYRSNSYWC